MGDSHINRIYETSYSIIKSKFSPLFKGGWGGSTMLNDSDFHLPYNPALNSRAKELRKNMTPAERKFWHKYLRTFQFKVYRQRPIDYFIVDFYCPSLKLVIEVDGESHYTDEGKDYDRERTQRLEGYGIKVIRFSNQEVLNEFEGVCDEIERMIPPSPP
jgi:very-short-patch-repair endonuclease